MSHAPALVQKAVQDRYVERDTSVHTSDQDTDIDRNYDTGGDRNRVYQTDKYTVTSNTYHEEAAKIENLDRHMWDQTAIMILQAT